MPNRLTPIIELKHQEVAALYQQLKLQPNGMLAQVYYGRLRLPPCKSFKQALQQEKLAIIAEIKRKSPSKGHLALITDPLALATRYHQGGANALSILTDTPFFGGSLSDLQQVAAHLAATRLPLLRKDFMVDAIQLTEARLAGADAVLAIVAVLGDQTPLFIEQAKAIGLDVLVEVHTEQELDIALTAGADIIGVNNRNLVTLEVDPEQAIRLGDKIPDAICKVAESGILVPELAQRYRQAGFDAVLIGEALVTTDNPQAFIEACREET